MKHSNITFFLAAYNEAFRIEYVVRNLVRYGRVVILDGGSTDSTKEVAEKWGAEFLGIDIPNPNEENLLNFD
jgi:glycosyltransferase involved in cell wall biosynthesis